MDVKRLTQITRAAIRFARVIVSISFFGSVEISYACAIILIVLAEHTALTAVGAPQRVLQGFLLTYSEVSMNIGPWESLPTQSARGYERNNKCDNRQSKSKEERNLTSHIVH